MENNIEILENFLSIDSCNFITNSFREYLSETDRPGIFGGPSKGINEAWKIGYGGLIESYSNDNNKNISIDLLTNSISTIKKIMSEKYNVDLDIRTVFYSKMIEGAEIVEHYDNYEPDGSFYFPYGTDEDIVNKIGLEPDYSAILYLNDKYSGGEIEFPNHNIKIKPNPGTLIFFKGDMNFPHLVNKVKFGERINLVMFLWKSEYRKKYFKQLNNN